MGFFDKVKGLFQGNSKKIKFFALLFVIVVLLYLAVSPSPTTNTSQILLDGGGNSMSLAYEPISSFGRKAVNFPVNPVTAIWK